MIDNGLFNRRPLYSTDWAGDDPRDAWSVYVAIPLEKEAEKELSPSICVREDLPLGFPGVELLIIIALLPSVPLT